MQIRSNNPNFDSGPNIGGWSNIGTTFGGQVILYMAILYSIRIIV